MLVETLIEHVNDIAHVRILRLSKNISVTGEFENRSSLHSSVFLATIQEMQVLMQIRRLDGLHINGLHTSIFCNSLSAICLPPDNFVNNSSSTAAISVLDAQNPIRV
jgi:hypothetical protein